MFNLPWTAPERIQLIDNSVTTRRTRFADIYSFGSVTLQVYNLSGYLDRVHVLNGYGYDLGSDRSNSIPQPEHHGYTSSP
jgi:hypothetical protein